MRAVKTESTGLRRLVDAGIALTSELSLEAVLQNIVEAAAALTGAQYAALGVINQSRSGLERFVVTGLDADAQAAIGNPPRGRGILGALIDDARALRLRNLADDPRSTGFPPNHPTMRSFLGVPVLLRGTAYGNLYLTEKQGADEFTEEDEELVQLLAAQAAVAIENARLYESATRWSRQLESLAELGNALASELELPRLLQLVAERLCELLEARLVVIALPQPDGSLRVEAAVGEGAEDARGTVISASSKSARVFERRRSERVDSLIDDPEVDQDWARRNALTSGMFVPLVAAGRAIGVIAMHDRRTGGPRFGDDDLRLAETFAARAAVAADLSARVARDALRRVVEAQELERRRLARELHDETGQALTSILLGLRGLEEAGDGQQHEAVAELRELVVTTLQDVRNLAVELRPKALDDFGLAAALDRLTTGFSEQTGIDVDLEARLEEERLPGEIETALYRIVQEALTNIVKHARAQRVSILVVRKPSSATVVIEDDGTGFSQPGSADRGGLGLVGMRERVRLLDGRFEIESSPGAGTTLVAEVPLP
jgi:signal transduction histidine kinase